MSASFSVHAGPNVWPIDEERGTWGMLLFIATEAMLFALLFYSYFYLGRNEPRWPTGADPSLQFPIPMTLVLLSSSFVLHHAEKLLKRNDRGGARVWVIATIVLGLAFVAIQAYEYVQHITKEPPTLDAYTSIFYTITSVHGAHVLLGLLMLTYVLLLPARQLEPAGAPPHRVLHNVSLYWHFVDLVWLFIFAILYLAPHFSP